MHREIPGLVKWIARPIGEHPQAFQDELPESLGSDGGPGRASVNVVRLRGADSNRSVISNLSTGPKKLWGAL